MQILIRLMLAISTLGLAANVRAEVVAFEILKREPYLGGKAFGDVGPYEQITAIARFAIDPNDARNRPIIDLDLAPKNANGKVEFSSDVLILTPKDPARGNGAIFYDVNNRGNKVALGMFNRAPGNAGDDGFLMRRGYTVIWSGWIGELLAGDGRFLLKAPQALQDGKLVRGPVNYEMSSDTLVKSLPLSRRPKHGSYPPTEQGEAKGVLTKRPHVDAPREVVPRNQWKIVRTPFVQVTATTPGTLPEVRLELEGGFEPGTLYELVCEAEGSLVQGVGFASVRDLISFLRHDTSAQNPLCVAGKPAVNRALAFGVSQSGRFLRHLLYLGFNEDTAGRIVFDGLMPHVAGGGLGFFNHRFAQPTRHNGQHEDHAYPADVFPFTYGPSIDPYSKKTDSILAPYAKSKTQPKIMHTQSAAEYWHRSGSLVHTDPLGQADADIPANVRIYSFGGTQHGPAAFPPSKGMADNHANFGDYRPLLRGLLVALDEWVTKDKAPPASVYPRLAERTLVPWSQDATGFPKIPGVRYPTTIQQPSFHDYGPEFASRGIISLAPPKKVGDYRVLVAKCDADGNDLGMLAPPEVATPLGTYTGWNTRRADAGADGALASLLGSFIPFEPNADSKDPRRPVSKRYADSKAYCQRLDESCERLVGTRYLLAEDRPLYAGYGARIWEYVVGK